MTSSEAIDETVSPWWASVTAGLVIARWLVPAESAADGETTLLVFLWCLLAAGWLYASIRSGIALRFDRVDGCVTALCGAFVLSGLLTLTQPANWRSAINLSVEWFGTGLCLVMVRQVVRPETVAVVLRPTVASLVALSVFGLYQHFVWYPGIAAQYEAFERLADDAEAGGLTTDEQTRLNMLAAELGPAAMQDAKGRAALRQRVVFSTEPIGFFALTNSFATGMMVAALLLAGQLRPRWSPDKFVTGIVLVLVAGCLILTKSRTAYVGTAVGIAVLLWQRSRFGRTNQRRGLVIVMGSVVVTGLVGLVAIMGGIDAEVITEASKSLRYRLEYWLATGDLLRDQPLLGTGLGQFRQHYFGVKFAAASEEISDPHNWPLEAWATGGLLGGLAAVYVVSRLLVASVSRNGEGAVTSMPRLLFDLIAIGSAWLFAVALGASVLSTASVCLLAIAGCVAIRRVGATFSNAATVAAASAITVHLLGAGGLNMPAIHQLWLVLLTIPTLYPDRVTRPFALRPAATRAALGVLVGITIAILYAAVLPNLQRRAAVSAAEFAAMDGSRSAIRMAKQAAAADPYSPDPYVLMASLPTVSKSDAIVATREAIRRDPMQPYLHERLARLLSESTPADALKAAATATELYPTSARLWLLRASLEQSQRLRMAAAERALSLNEAKRDAGHADKLLTQAEADELQQLLSEAVE